MKMGLKKVPVDECEHPLTKEDEGRVICNSCGYILSVYDIGTGEEL